MINDKKRLLNLIRMGIVLAFVLQLGLMISEYINYSGGDLLFDLDFVERSFIICKGDTTTWFHSEMLVDYSIYGLLAVFASVLLVIENLLEKNRIVAIVTGAWVTMAAINVVSGIILSYSNGYALSLMVYQKMFLTLQFFRTDNIWIKSCLGAVLFAYIAIHLIYIKYIVEINYRKKTLNIFMNNNQGSTAELLHNKNPKL